jgi:hypothetical protein
LKIHMLNAHEGRTWSRKKKGSPLDVKPIEVETPKTLADVKHCPSCGTQLDDFRGVRPIYYCPVDGTPLRLWVEAVKIVDKIKDRVEGNGGVPL